MESWRLLETAVFERSVIFLQFTINVSMSSELHTVTKLKISAIRQDFYGIF